MRDTKMFTIAPVVRTLSAVLLSAVSVLSLTGCQNQPQPTATGPNRSSQPETCNFVATGLLHDYRSNACVRPTRDDFDRLYYSNHFNEMVRRGDTPTAFGIVFRNRPTAADFRYFLGQYFVADDKILGVKMFLPNAPEGGLSVGATINIGATTAAVLEDVERAVLGRWSRPEFQELKTELLATISKYLVEAFQRDDYVIADFDVRTTPSAVLHIMKARDVDIESIRPLNQADQPTVPSLDDVSQLQGNAP